MAKSSSSRRLPENMGYFELSQRPMASLALLLPLVGLYELGTLAAGSEALGGPDRIVAFAMLDWFFSMFGAASFHLPALAVVAILLASHLASRDPWTIHLPTTVLMAIESAALAMPLLVLGRLAGSVAFSTGQAGGWVDEVVLSVGAGIYEELLFRLILISLLGMLLVDVVRLKKTTGYGIAVVVSSVLFAWHHYEPLTGEPFVWGTFIFRAVAGFYLAGVFVARGFGLAVGCHAAYDVILAMMHFRGDEGA